MDSTHTDRQGPEERAAQEGTRGRERDVPAARQVRRRSLDVFFLAPCLVLFLLLSTHQLHLPGLHYDEAKEAGNNALQLLSGLPVEAFRDVAIRSGRLRLPLMVQDYIGALNVYLAVPFLGVFGPTVPALRLLPIALALLTLWLTYRLALEAVGRWAAIVATLLLAGSPSFVFWSRQGIFVTNVTATIAVGSLLVALRWWRTRSPRHLYLLAFLWGLGIYAKLLFVWVVLSTLAVLVGVRVARWWAARRTTANLSGALGEATRDQVATGRVLRQVALAAVSFLVPLLPLIVFNVISEGTAVSVRSNWGSSYYGVQNADLGRNLVERLRQFVVLLRSGHLWYLGDHLENTVAPWIALALLLAATVTAVHAAMQRRTTPWHSAWTWVAPLAIVALTVAQSSLTVSDLFITHYAIMLPIVFLAAGAMVGWLARGAPKAALAIALVGVVWWMGSDIWLTVRYHQELTRSGGYSSHSDVVYDLAEYLESRAIEEPVAMDWGIAAPVYFLTGGAVRPLEGFGYERIDGPAPEFESRLRGLLRDPSRVFVFHVPEETVFQGRREVFDDLLEEGGLEPAIEAVFHDRSGRLMLVLTRVHGA